MKVSEYNHVLQIDDKKYIYNSFSKSSICVNNADFKMEDFEKLNSEQVEVLLKEGFWVEDDCSEFEMLKYMFSNNYFGDNSLLNIVLVPGMDCNFKCPYCFEKFREIRLCFRRTREDIFQY